jgi:hypothetical protein
MTNNNYDIRGVPFTFLKEDSKCYVFYNYVNRHLYTLQGSADNEVDNVVKITLDKNIKLNLFSLDNLISIKKCD